MRKTQDLPDTIRPYVFHGLDLQTRGKEAVGTCPFCGRDKKFSVNIESGQWRCFVCAEGSEKGGGNIYTFFRLLLEADSGNSTEELSEERGLLSPDTLDQWKVAHSVITGECIVPTYSVAGQINQLYRYVKIGEKRRLLPTPTLGHGLFGLHLYNPKKSNVYLCEGIWNASAFYEVAKVCRRLRGFDGLVPSPNEGASLLASSNIVGVPGCGTFDEKWLPLFHTKKVYILFDSDHPKRTCKTCKKSYSILEDNGNCPLGHGELSPPDISPSGYVGLKRVVRLLLSSPKPPEEINYLHWGEEGYDPEVTSGYDIGDILTKDSPSLQERVKLLSGIVEKVKPVPSSWVQEAITKAGAQEIQPKHCSDWNTLISAWKKALTWTDGLDTALSVMLASVTSTKALGDQLWIKVIGPASCGKSTLCEALSVASKHVIAKSTIRGFHSGYKTDKDAFEDNSLVALVRDKTLVTKDGDTLLQSPNLGQILSEARDLYDSVARTHYRNKTSRDYTGVRMTWILCGTSSLRYIDQSELGERFLDVQVMEGIDDDLEDQILLSVAARAERALSYESNGRAEGQHEPDLALAMRLTGGYVEYLRSNAQRLLDSTRMGAEALRRCARLGKFVAYIRARPSQRQEEVAEREFGARLVSQHVRLAKCLAVVLGRKEVDEEVMRRVTKVALDTARGRTLDIAKLLYKEGDKGCETKSLSIWAHETEDKLKLLLRFLRKIGAVELFTSKITTGYTTKPRWRLTERIKNLYKEVTSA